MTEPGYAKGRARRRQIILQALAMFGEVGYRGASLREIAARCGISHPGLLHHFPTKELLLQAVLEQRDAEDRAWMGVTVTGADRLLRLVDLVALNATRRGIVELFCVLSAEGTSSEHPAHGYFVRRYQASLSAIEGAYAQARDAGALRAGVDPRIAAQQVVALMDGLQLQWLLDGGATDMAGVVLAHLRTQLVPAESHRASRNPSRNPESRRGA